VLEQVSKAGAALRLIPRAHVVINADRNDRHGLVLVEDNPQTIIESELFYRGVWNAKMFLHLKAQLEYR